MRNTICEDLNISDIGKDVSLSGWVDRRRDHGGVIFIDLRDHSGYLQLTFNPEDGNKLFNKAENLRIKLRCNLIIHKYSAEHYFAKTY